MLNNGKSASAQPPRLEREVLLANHILLWPPDFEIHEQVTKADFILALGQLGLVLTHGQATALAAEHHEDYEKFLSKLGDARRSSEVGLEWK